MIEIIYYFVIKYENFHIVNPNENEIMMFESLFWIKYLKGGIVTFAFSHEENGTSVLH